MMQQVGPMLDGIRMNRLATQAAGAADGCDQVSFGAAM
jgi:hypothetical protein